MTKRGVAAAFALILALMTGLLAGCGGGLPNDAMAKVGDEYITEEQFNARLADFKSSLGSSVPDEEDDPDGYKEFQRQVLDYMVTYEIVQQKAQSLGISVSDAEVENEIQSIITNSFGGDQEQFDAALKEQGLTLDQLKTSYRESMLLQKAYDQVTKDVTTVSDADILAYYNEHKSDYFVDETRTARHILISPTADRPTTTSTTAATSSSTSADGTASTTSTAPSTTTTTEPPTEAEWAAALAKAEKVRADLVAGADWTDEAKQYSDDTGTKDAGGDLGTVYKGQMVPEFDEAVFSLELNEISQPIKTSYGYHIIQVTEITPAKQYTLEEVKDTIKSALLSEAKSKCWTEWLTKTKAELGVIYKEGMELVTTTTTVPASTSTTAAGDTSTTATSTADTAGATTTTGSAAATTTTAKP